MQVWENVFFVILLVYQISLLIPRHRRPLILSAFLPAAGAVLLFILGKMFAWVSPWPWEWPLLELRWPLGPAIGLWLAETVFLMASLSTLRGATPGIGAWVKARQIFRTVGATVLLWFAFVFWMLALLFPPAPDPLSRPVALTRGEFRISGGPGGDAEVYTVFPDPKSPRSWPALLLLAEPGESPKRHRFMAADLAAKGFFVCVVGAPEPASAPSWPLGSESFQKTYLEPALKKGAAFSPIFAMAQARMGLDALARLTLGRVPALIEARGKILSGGWGLVSFAPVPDSAWGELPGLAASVVLAPFDAEARPGERTLRLWWKGALRADLDDSAYTAPYLTLLGLKSRWDARISQVLVRYAAAFFSWKLQGGDPRLLTLENPLFPEVEIR